jgi:hypothetical protein
MRRALDAALLFTIVPALAHAQGAAAVSTTPKLTGYLQPRFQALGDSTTFQLRRARFAIEGVINSWANYRAQVEMRTLGAPATPPASPLTLSATDLWVRLSHHQWGGTIGQFRVPYSLESLLSSTTLETTERSRVVTAARRDIGVQADWRLPDRITVQAAVVNGEGPNRGANPDNRVAYLGRVMITPVKGLDVGGAFEGYNDSTGVDGQAIYRGKRWTARAEYIQDHNRRSAIHARGWYALAAFGAVPRRVQLVGRVQQYDPNDRITADRLTGYLLGAQYFMKGDDFKLLADYEVFREQVTQLKNNRGVIQMQVRW